MQLEINKEYITNNAFVVRVEMIEAELAYATVLGIKIAEEERRRIYTLEGKDANNEAFDIEQKYDSSYLKYNDLPLRLEEYNWSNKQQKYFEEHRYERFVQEPPQKQFEETNQEMIKSFMDQLVEYMKEHDIEPSEDSIRKNDK